MVAKIDVGNKLMRVIGYLVLSKVHEWLWILNQVEDDGTTPGHPRPRPGDPGERSECF
jgi:hypothetical protein